MTEVEDVLSEARRYLGTVENPRGSNRGVVIDYALQEAGVGLGLPWCAAWVGLVGRQALGHRWPVPRTASVVSIQRWAEGHVDRWLTVPEAGDLFLLWNAKVDGGRFAHVGFVAAVGAEGFDSLEGNSNPGGGRDGYGVFALKRKLLSTSRYVRWVAALDSLHA